MDDKYITILDDNGEEQLAEILFTFPHGGENFILLTPIKEFEDIDDLDGEYTVYAYKYEELEDGSIGNLIEISSQDTEEWELIEEMLNTFEDGEFNGGSDDQIR